MPAAVGDAAHVCVVLYWLDGERATTRQLARYFRISESYLHKTMSALARAGIVTATRGHGGGYTLVDPSGGRTLNDIATALGYQFDVAVTESLHHHTELLSRCAIDDALTAAMTQARRALWSHTIASLSAGLHDYRKGGHPKVRAAFAQRFQWC